MKRLTIAAAALLFAVTANAQNETPATVKVGGFIRDYAHMDTKEMVAGTADLFSYIPKETQADDMTTYHYTAMTSRLWVTADGYKYGNMTANARIEADFYNGVSGVTGTAVFRLRQAFMNLSWTREDGSKIGSLKAGQAWHPMAADMPDIFSLNTGAPFGPFSRTPLIQWDAPLAGNLSYTLAGVWQMQYTSCGPGGASADYIKFSGIPELYFGLNYKAGNALFRVGYDFLSLKPYKNVGNRVNSSLVFAYGQYSKGLFTAKAKTTFGQDGSHLNLTGGYAVTGGTTAADYEFTSSTSSSTWMTLSYGKKWQGVLFAGYIKNFGVGKEIKEGVLDNKVQPLYFFCKNSFKNVNSVWRLTPTVLRNIGKFTVGVECELTSAQYGALSLADGTCAENTHNVLNTRLQGMLKFTF
ncbi:MAG: hypothetical protein KBT08_02770 [Bacteroidales bacterium]|nr:hypothetical protein [Candidatus Cryptobacteroides onthequi]